MTTREQIQIIENQLSGVQAAKKAIEVKQKLGEQLVEASSDIGAPDWTEFPHDPGLQRVSRFVDAYRKISTLQGELLLQECEGQLAQANAAITELTEALRMLNSGVVVPVGVPGFLDKMMGKKQ